MTKDKTQDILKAVQIMARKRILVGIPQEKNRRKKEKGKSKELTNSEIGFLQENGSPAQNIPARPFLKPGVQSTAPQVASVLGKAAKKSFLNSKKLVEGLTAAGLISQAGVKKYIVQSDHFKPLAQSTLDARARRGKKGTKPLIRTGQLLNSISFVIRDK